VKKIVKKIDIGKKIDSGKNIEIVEKI